MDSQTLARLDELERRHETYNGKTFEGTLRWIDASSGEGLGSLPDGQTFYVNFTVIDTVEPNGQAWPTGRDQRRLASLGVNVPIKVKIWVSGGGALYADRVTIPTLGD